MIKKNCLEFFFLPQMCRLSFHKQNLYGNKYTLQIQHQKNIAKDEKKLTNIERRKDMDQNCVTEHRKK